MLFCETKTYFQGVTKAVGHINDTIGPALIQSVSRKPQIDYKNGRLIIQQMNAFLFQGISVLEQENLDSIMIDMDGTENKCKSS